MAEGRDTIELKLSTFWIAGTSQTVKMNHELDCGRLP
jgi:hypothetical protein